MNKSILKNLLLVGVFSLIASGCASVPSIKVPILPAPNRQFPPPPIAVIRVPVVVNLPITDLTTVGSSPLTWNIPKTLPQLIEFTKGAALQSWQDPLHLQASQATLSTLMRVRYRLGEDVVGLSLKGASQTKALWQNLFKPQESLVTMKTVLQWNPSWRLEALPSFEVSSLVNKPVTALTAQIRDLANQAAEDALRKEAARFDERLKTVSNLEPRAREIWAQLQEPIFLDKGIWFLLQPKDIGVAPLQLSPLHPQTLSTALELTAYPELLFGPKPKVFSSPLPPLFPYHEGSGGFRAVSNLLISYPEAGNLIRDLHMGVIGHVFKETGDRKLKIKGLRFYGSGGKVVAEVKLQYEPILNLSDKPAQMTAYLVGTLKYRPKRRAFELPDLDYDVKTSDFLVQVADWIFKSDIRNLLRSQAKIPVGPKLDDLKQKLSTALNRSLGPGLNLTTRVDDFQVIEAFADNEGMKARVVLDGSALLKADWKGEH